MLRIAVVTASFAALLGCSSLDSADLLTDGISAEVAVTADGSGDSEVSTVLRAGGGLSTTFVELSGDDQLTATLGDETQVLQQVSLGNLVSYTTTFDSAPVDTDFVVSLDRMLDEGATQTTVRLPEPFEIEALQQESFSRADDDLTVTWTPSDSGDDMRVVVDGDCFIVNMEDLSGDPGTWTLEAGTLEDTGEEARSCEATVTVQRRRSGTLDPNYGEGGSAVGMQVREISLSSSP